MPPQQGKGLTDGIDQLFGFSAHWLAILVLNSLQQQGVCAPLPSSFEISVDPAALVQVTRLLCRVLTDQRPALVGEADYGVGVVRILSRFERLHHRI